MMNNGGNGGNGEEQGGGFLSVSLFSVSSVVVLLLCFLPAGAQEDPSASVGRILRSLRDQVAPSVVSIEVFRTKDPEGRGGSGPSGTHGDYYNRPEGPCTGTIWTSDGVIVTSAFNVSGEVRRIAVRTADGRVHEAKRLGSDGPRDIAVLKIDARDLPVLPKADFGKRRAGDLVAVVGRAPDAGAPTINWGILSALRRMDETAVQTDAELNYGNVGGPLVTLAGELVGVTCQIKPRTSWGQSGGVGFACGHPEIDRALPDLVAGRSVARRKDPWIGILAAEGAEGVEGVPVSQVLEGGPAERAGVKPGDVITGFDGGPVKSFDELRGAIRKKKIGEEAALKVERTDEKGAKATHELKVVVGENPD